MKDWCNNILIHPDLHIYQGLPQLPPDAAEEAERYGDLEEEAVDHDEMTDTHVTSENVPCGHHHDTSQCRAEYLKQN